MRVKLIESPPKYIAGFVSMVPLSKACTEKAPRTRVECNTCWDRILGIICEHIEAFITDDHANVKQYIWFTGLQLRLRREELCTCVHGCFGISNGGQTKHSAISTVNMIRMQFFLDRYMYLGLRNVHGKL